MHAPAAAGLFSQPVQCGRTAYPNLTGQRFCGAYTIKDLNSHPQCTDALKTLPICVKKPGGPVNATAGWYDYSDEYLEEIDAILVGMRESPTLVNRSAGGSGLWVEELGRDNGQAQERAVDVQITRLRRKIEPDPREPRFLLTVRGQGYVLHPD